MMRQICNLMLGAVVCFGVAQGVARAGTQDLLLGFNDAAGPTSAQNDYVIDLGLEPSNLVSKANANGGTYVFTNIINSATFQAAFSADSAYLNNVAAGIVTGATPQSGNYLLYVSAPTGISGLIPTSAINNGTWTGDAIKAQGSYLGEYPSAQNPVPNPGWSDLVAVSPTVQGTGQGGNIAGDDGNPMTNLVGGDIKLELAGSVGTGLRAFMPSPWYLVGTFDINVNTLNVTFTSASSGTPAPTVTAVTASVTNGFAPLTVAFNSTVTGTATSWVWNFGNGVSVTNSTGASVTNTYPAAGFYSVSLTATGPGGSSALALANGITVLSPPKIGGVALVGGHLVLSGTGNPPNVSYRLLTSTNVTAALATWQPVVTNTFSSTGTFAFTNTLPGATRFFKLVSP